MDNANHKFQSNAFKLYIIESILKYQSRHYQCVQYTKINYYLLHIMQWISIEGAISSVENQYEYVLFKHVYSWNEVLHISTHTWTDKQEYLGWF